jgi:hypothetical protein
MSGSFATVCPVAGHFRSSPNIGRDQIISLPATNATAGHSLKSSVAAGPPSGSSCTHSLLPANSPCIACTAQARVPASPSVSAPRRAQQSGACRSRDTAPQGTVARVQRVTQGRRRLRWSLIAEHPIVPRLTRQPVCLLAGRLWHARRTCVSLCRTGTRGTWWTCPIMGLNGPNGKPLRFGRQRHGAYSASWVCISSSAGRPLLWPPTNPEAPLGRVGYASHPATIAPYPHIDINFLSRAGRDLAASTFLPRYGQVFRLYKLR